VERAEIEAALPHQREYWLALGVIEEDEQYFKTWWRYARDLEEVEARFRDTPLDAPPLEAWRSLPDSPTAYRNYKIGYAYIRYLKNVVRPFLVEGRETATLDALVDDTQRRVDVWYAIYRCGGNYSGVVGRRAEMHLLREVVGREAFERGEWPDPLPPAAYLHYWEDDTQQWV
jgi:hypothetical protein